MPIKYALFENNITSDTEDLVSDIVDQGSTANKPDNPTHSSRLPIQRLREHTA